MITITVVGILLIVSCIITFFKRKRFAGRMAKDLLFATLLTILLICLLVFQLNMMIHLTDFNYDRREEKKVSHTDYLTKIDRHLFIEMQRTKSEKTNLTCLFEWPEQFIENIHAFFYGHHDPTEK